MALAVLVATMAVPTSALASPITATYSMTLTLLDGTDTLGLVGANLTLTATFDFPQNYVEEFAIPAVFSTSNALTISGASVGATNGTYTEPDGIHFFPTYPGQIWSGIGLVPTYQVNGQEFTLEPFSDTVAVNIGDPFNASHFLSLDSASYWVSNTAIYGLENLDLNVTGGTSSVPEPATLTLLGLSALGTFARARRRNPR
jgi:hypothetical protein